MFLFCHSWIFQLPLTHMTTAYFFTDCNTCMVSPALHFPCFLLIWQIEHSQSSSMTTSHKSQAFPMVCHRVLCWAQFSSSSTQNLFLTWFSVTRLSLKSFANDTHLQVSVPPSNIQSAISSLETCLSDIQTWMPENKLKLNNDKTEALLLRYLLSPFQSPNLLPSLSVAVKYLFCSSARNLGFYIRDDISVVLHIKKVCRLVYSELRRINTIRQLLSADSTKTLCPPLSSLGSIIVTRSFRAALKNYNRSKTQLQDSS